MNNNLAVRKVLNIPTYCDNFDKERKLYEYQAYMLDQLFWLLDGNVDNITSKERLFKLYSSKTNDMFSMEEFDNYYNPLVKGKYIEEIETDLKVNDIYSIDFCNCYFVDKENDLKIKAGENFPSYEISMEEWIRRCS